MSYITENPWPLIVLLVGVAGAAFASGAARGKEVAAVCLLAATGIFFLERSLISSAEEVEIEIATMLDNFKARDLDAITAQICRDKENVIAKAKEGLDLVELGDSFAIKDIQVTFDSETTATAMVRANGNVSARRSGGLRYAPSFWRTTWSFRDETWKLSSATQLHPVNGTNLGTFSTE